MEITKESAHLLFAIILLLGSMASFRYFKLAYKEDKTLNKYLDMDECWSGGGVIASGIIALTSSIYFVIIIFIIIDKLPRMK